MKSAERRQDVPAQADPAEVLINQKLTAHLMANAIKTDIQPERTAPAVRKNTTRGFGSIPVALAQLAGLPVLVLLMCFAAVHAYLYETKES